LPSARGQSAPARPLHFTSLLSTSPPCPSCQTNRVPSAADTVAVSAPFNATRCGMRTAVQLSLRHPPCCCYYNHRCCCRRRVEALADLAFTMLVRCWFVPLSSAPSSRALSAASAVTTHPALTRRQQRSLLEWPAAAPSRTPDRPLVPIALPSPHLPSSRHAWPSFCMNPDAACRPPNRHATIMVMAWPHLPAALARSHAHTSKP